MTKEQLKPEEQALKIIACSQIIIDNIEATEELGFFNKAFKYYFNRFTKELEKVENRLYANPESRKELVNLGQVFYNEVDDSINKMFEDEENK